MTLQIGEVLKDRYRIIQLFASGGMGIVYRAKDESLGVEVALKVTFPGAKASNRMQKTASLLAGLHHPNLPRVTDTFQLPGGEQILVMDFVPGEDLKTRIDRSGPLPVTEAIEIIIAAGSALQYLHSQKPPVIHQDMKPGNIRIRPDRHVMLVDFDLITILEGDQTKPPSNEQGLTPGFASPEQYNNMADARSDQYGLAATLYFALTATRLPDALTRASGNSQLPERNLHHSHLPLDVITCLERALAINPADRYPNVTSFLDALSAIQIAQPQTAQITTRKLRSQKVGRPAKPYWLYLTVLTIVAVLGIVIYYLVQNQGTDNREVIQNLPTASPGSSIPTSAPERVAANPISTALPSPKPAETIDEVKNFEPTPLGGGRGEFAFVSEKTGKPQIFLASTKSVETRQLTNIPEGACQPDWAPDGLRLIFTSPCLTKQQLVGKPEPFNGSGLFILTIDSGNITPLPSLPGGDFDPAWSPDGSSIAFTSLRTKFAQIFLYDIASEKVTQITRTTSNNRQPAWSPDAAIISFSTNRTGPSQVWLMNGDGSNPKEFSILANGAAFTPAWSPDGKEIVYSQTNSLRLVSRRTGEVGADESILNVRLIFASNPEFSPDGNWILIDSHMEGTQRVYRITRTGTGIESISPAGETAYQAVWKPPSP